MKCSLARHLLKNQFYNLSWKLFVLISQMAEVGVAGVGLTSVSNNFELWTIIRSDRIWVNRRNPLPSNFFLNFFFPENTDQTILFQINPSEPKWTQINARTTTSTTPPTTKTTTSKTTTAITTTITTTSPETKQKQ